MRAVGESPHTVKGCLVGVVSAFLPILFLWHDLTSIRKKPRTCLNCGHYWEP